MTAPSLYIHVPFCRHRCGYCNFTLVANRDRLIERYLSALQSEMECFPEHNQVDTVFLGGGTPSHLDSHQLKRLFELVHLRFDIASDAEITVECNPSDLDVDKVQLFNDLNVNRLSLGVQSFDSAKLSLLERDHRCADVEQAITLARQVTDNVSLDLIFGTPAETLSSWETDLKSAIDLGPAHISTYELTIEKGTRFWNQQNRGTLGRPDEELLVEMYQQAIEVLASNDFIHYEVSSFCRPEKQCRHNQTYWNGGQYLAFGPGAARFVNSTREVNHRSTTTYLKLIESGLSPVVERECLDTNAMALDRIVFGLRQTSGVSTGDFQRDFDIDAKSFLGDVGNRLVDQKLLVWTNETCRLTEQGILMYDSVADCIVASKSG